MKATEMKLGSWKGDGRYSSMDFYFDILEFWDFEDGTRVELFCRAIIGVAFFLLNIFLISGAKFNCFTYYYFSLFKVFYN